MTPLRAEAETFIRLVEQCRRGRLLLCLAPPWSQAAHLSQMAQNLARRGLEVVLAYLDCAGQETACAGLESLPRQRLEYRGLVLEEMDLQGVLDRRPQVAVVQDLAHANAPGAPNPSRHEDVRQLLAAGISVLASADPWQLEGLPGINPPEPSPRRHGLPASFWRRADQIVLPAQLPPGSGSCEGEPCLPLPSEAQEALRSLSARQAAGAGKIAAPETAPACQRLMVCLPSQPSQAQALLQGLRGLAGPNGSSWFAVRVLPPSEEPPAAGLEQACQEARRLGAEVVLLRGKDAVVSLLDFARAHGVRHIVVGRSRGGLRHGLWRSSLGLRLLRQGQDFDLHILDLAQPRS